MKSRARGVVASSLVLAAIFEAALFASKETPAVYAHAPWLNDPYDTAVSFALFCIPLIVVPTAARLLADRRLPDRGAPERLADLLRACGVALIVLAITLAACWAGVAGGANRAGWNSVTAVQVGVLSIVSVGTIAGAFGVRRAAVALRRDTDSARPASRPAPDWLGDMMGVARLLAGLGGPAGFPLARGLDWIDDRIIPRVRRHPIGAATVLASMLGLLVTISQSVGEGYGPVLAAVFFGVVASGVFAFVMIAGWYLRVIRTDRPRARVPVIHATVLAAAAVPVALAFRAPLWSLVGMHASGGFHALVLLLASAALLAFGAVLAAERLARPRRRPAEPPAR
jgi:hypothetical protein